MKPIRVVFVINDFSAAGAQKLVADVLHHIDRSRFQPALVTLFDVEEGATMYHLLPSDIEIIRMNFKSFFDGGSWIRLYRALIHIHADVVVSHLFFSNAIVRILKLFLGYQAIATEHNTYINKSSLHQRVDRLLSIWTYAIIAVSTTVKTFTASQEKIPLSKFRVIHNGTDIARSAADVQNVNVNDVKEELGLDTNTRIIINVARLSTQKNHSLLVKGFAEFASSNKDIHLVIVGEGEERHSLEEETHKLGIDDRIHFLGYRQDVYRYYAASDFFISTSTIEGLSLAYIEALAAGLPILSTKTSGTDEMIEEGKNGFFIQDHTPVAVANGLNRMIAADLHTMRKDARTSADRFDIVTTTKKYEDLITEAAGVQSGYPAKASQ